MEKIVSFILLLMSTVACVKYDAAPFEGRVLPRACGYVTGVSNDWIYYNLRTGECFNAAAPGRDIKEGEQLLRDDWDLAFCGYRLRTNSGTSGPGLGGAADLGFGGYAGVNSASEVRNLDFTADDSVSVRITMSLAEWNHYLVTEGLDFDAHPWFDPNEGPVTMLTSANPVLAGAIEFSSPPPAHTPSFHTYIVRSACGSRYFKLQIVSWYAPDSAPGTEGGRISWYADELL